VSWTPDLVVAGVAKCGTTTLYDMLVAHPCVCGGIEKEVRFLMDHDDELIPAANVHSWGLQGWVEQFPDRGKGDFDVWVDASPQYQYQDTALQELAAIEQKPLVAFIVRKPSQRLYSLYQYARYHQRRMPHIESFAQFIDEIRPPVTGPLAKQKMMRTAWEDSQYDLTYERWAAALGDDRLFFTSVEQLGEDRFAVLSALSERLGLDPAPLREPPVIQSNPTVVTRSKLVKTLGARAAKILPDIGPVRRAKTFVRELNSGTVDRSEKADNAPLLAQLDEEFAKSEKRFAELSGVRLP